MQSVLEVSIPRSRSETARQVLERISWRGYMPPPAHEHGDVAWHLPSDQIDLIRTVLQRNRRLAGRSPIQWSSIDRVCETIAEESKRTGTRPHYCFDTLRP